MSIAQSWVLRGLHTARCVDVGLALVTEAVFNMVVLRSPARMLPSGLVTQVRQGGGGLPNSLHRP